jgi:hypothetical protein
VLGLWEGVKSPKSSLDTIYLDYALNDDLVDEMINRGYTEIDVVGLVRLFPPTKIRL